MKFSKEKPPNWNKILEYFPEVKTHQGIIVTYGDTIYCKYELGSDKIAHEDTHVRQQTSMGPEKWWKMYFENKNFRLLQEVEAYKNEIRFINLIVKDRNKKYRMVRQIALDLSSEIYGGMVTFNEALQLLK